MPAEARTEESKRTKAQKHIQRVVDRISTKSTNKLQSAMDNKGKDLAIQTACSAPTDLSQEIQVRRKSIVADVSVSTRAFPLVQSTVTVLPSSPTKNAAVNSDYMQGVTVEKPVDEMHQEMDCTTQTPKPRSLKDLPPTPLLQEGPGFNALDPHGTGNVDEQNLKNDQDLTMDALCSENEALRLALEHEHRQNQELHQQVAMWKARTSHTAIKSANIPSQFPLSRPESELLKDWQTLDFDIRNLVANHFGGGWDNRILSWAKAKKEWLCDLTSDPVDIASNKKSGPALVEAVIWTLLVNLVLGGIGANGSLCWAGAHRERLRRLYARLEADWAQTDAGLYNVVHHQWKALTASIVSGVRRPQDRNEEVDRIMEEMEEHLAPCRSRSAARAYRSDLQSVVSKAIELNLRLCGQQTLYFVRWPGKERYNIKIDRERMKPVNSPTSSTVKFIIRPCLVRAESEAESFNVFMLVDPCSVWA